MGAIAFQPGFLAPSFSAASKSNLGKPFFCLKLKEIADRPSTFPCQKHFTQLTVSSIRANGNRRGRPPLKDISSGQTSKRIENKGPQSSDGKSTKSPNQEEIIALFRRIKSSISKRDSANPKTRSSKSSQDSTSAESVTEVLRLSRKQIKGGKEEGNKGLTRSRGVSQSEQEVQEYPSAADPRLTRPPSNFVKRSPIPSSSSPRKVVDEQKIGPRAAVTKEELPTLDKMKLCELKELAKSKGIRGYSKLKKRELVVLLRSSL
ncbi:hypothetical protein NMG60_11012870 [Bertholletia excelsa]